MLFVVYALIGYIIGSIPSGVLLAKLMGYKDPRSMGSGNIGAANLTRLGGVRLGALTLASDFAKGFLPVMVYLFYFPWDKIVVVFIAFAAVLGHCYSLFLKFSGGKGVATTAGVLVPLAPISVLVGLGVWVLCFVAKRIASLSSLLAATTVPIAMAFMDTPPSIILLAVASVLLIFLKHEKNLKALLKKEEPSFVKRKENESKEPGT